MLSTSHFWNHIDLQAFIVDSNRLLVIAGNQDKKRIWRVDSLPWILFYYGSLLVSSIRKLKIVEISHFAGRLAFRTWLWSTEVFHDKVLTCCIKSMGQTICFWYYWNRVVFYGPLNLQPCYRESSLMETFNVCFITLAKKIPLQDI